MFQGKKLKIVKVNSRKPFNNIICVPGVYASIGGGVQYRNSMAFNLG